MIERKSIPTPRPRRAANSQAPPRPSDPVLTTRSVAGRRALSRRGLDRLMLQGGSPSSLWKIKSSLLDRFAVMTLDPSINFTEAVRWLVLLDLDQNSVARSSACRFQERFRVACDDVLRDAPLDLTRDKRSSKRAARERQARTSKPR